MDKGSTRLPPTRGEGEASSPLDRIRSLRAGRFGAVRPGSNFLSLFELETPLGLVSGEEIDALHRAGLLTATRMDVPAAIYPAARIDMPDACDIEIDHWWSAALPAEPASAAATSKNPSKEKR